MATITKNDILEALIACYDPEIPLNVVALGLIRTIGLEPDHDAPGAGIAGVPEKFTLHLEILATTEDEAARSILTAQIQNRLAGIEALSHVTVHILEDPWTPALISKEGRRTLGLDQPAFPILNNRLRS